MQKPFKKCVFHMRVNRFLHIRRKNLSGVFKKTAVFLSWFKILVFLKSNSWSYSYICCAMAILWYFKFLNFSIFPGNGDFTVEPEKMWYLRIGLSDFESKIWFGNLPRFYINFRHQYEILTKIWFKMQVGEKTKNRLFYFSLSGWGI